MGKVWGLGSRVQDPGSRVEGRIRTNPNQPEQIRTNPNQSEPIRTNPNSRTPIYGSQKADFAMKSPSNRTPSSSKRER